MYVRNDDERFGEAQPALNAIGEECLKAVSGVIPLDSAVVFLNQAICKFQQIVHG